MREDNKDIPYTEVMKKIGDAWNNLPGDEKEVRLRCSAS